MPSETSSVIVLPIRSAPESSRVCTAQACRSGTGLVRAQSGLPPPVGWPATSNRSLAAKVRPESGPPARPAMRNRCPGTKAPKSSLPGLASSVICTSAQYVMAGLVPAIHVDPGTSPGMTIVGGRMQHAFLAAEQFAERLGGGRVRQDDRQAERQQGLAVALGEADAIQEDRVGALRLQLLAGIDEGVFRSARSEEHTSELQSLRHLVCRL